MNAQLLISILRLSETSFLVKIRVLWRSNCFKFPLCAVMVNYTAVSIRQFKSTFATTRAQEKSIWRVTFLGQFIQEKRVYCTSLKLR
ncbi:hypothetical protein BDA96_09G092200 [Sorghum bicolor]|nr:hypothetical protein BDA96_09G092200 [Sorghum bicolor]